jgi:hypothetical protein
MSSLNSSNHLVNYNLSVSISFLLSRRPFSLCFFSIFVPIFFCLSTLSSLSVYCLYLSICVYVFISLCLCVSLSVSITFNISYIFRLLFLFLTSRHTISLLCLCFLYLSSSVFITFFLSVFLSSISL